MQNKYKLPDHVRAAALAVVKSYEPFKRDIETDAFVRVWQKV